MAVADYFDYPQDGRKPRSATHWAWKGTGLHVNDCPLCSKAMVPVHGHYECRGPDGCGYRDSCCDGGDCR